MRESKAFSAQVSAQIALAAALVHDCPVQWTIVIAFESCRQTTRFKALPIHEFVSDRLIRTGRAFLNHLKFLAVDFTMMSLM